jgi:hypothetical protein
MDLLIGSVVWIRREDDQAPIEWNRFELNTESDSFFMGEGSADLRPAGVDRICFPDRGESIALRSPCCAQALGDHRSHPSNAYVRPMDAAGKTCDAMQSCIAQKAGDLQSIANPARRMRRALFFTLRKTNIDPLRV